MANRNRTAMSEALFDLLIGRVAESGVSVPETKRWVRRLNNDDAEMMAKAKCTKLVLSRQQKTILISYQSKLYFGVAGFAVCDVLPEGLKIIDLTPALFSLAQAELYLELTATVAEIRDILDSSQSDIADYHGDDVTQISKLFTPVFFYEVNSYFEIGSSIERLTGSYVCRAYVAGPLLIEEQTRERLSALFESSGEYIPFLVVLSGVLSFSWNSLFLELYRCLEYLYPVPRLSDLCAELTLNRPLHEVAELLGRLLSWRPREDESLIRVLRYCSAGPAREVLQALGHEANDESEQLTELSARAVYQLRNSIVHFRPSTHQQAIGETEWNMLVRAMADFIAEAYKKVGSQLHNAPPQFSSDVCP